MTPYDVFRTIKQLQENIFVDLRQIVQNVGNLLKLSRGGHFYRMAPIYLNSSVNFSIKTVSTPSGQHNKHEISTFTCTGK